MLIVAPKGAVLIDVPATKSQTQQVLDWAEMTLKHPVQGVVCTHAHEDRIGGLSAAHARGIVSYSLALTQTLADSYGFTPPQRPLGFDETLFICGTSLQVFFPGAGHTSDNLIVWVPSSKVLFGGCFIKELASNSIGNLAEANPLSWKLGISRVHDRFHDAQIVIPGHGRPGGIELISHTQRLVNDWRVK
jgi:metallo-beta-lactamase class B